MNTNLIHLNNCIWCCSSLLLRRLSSVARIACMSPSPDSGCFMKKSSSELESWSCFEPIFMLNTFPIKWGCGITFALGENVWNTFWVYLNCLVSVIPLVASTICCNSEDIFEDSIIF